MDTIYQGFPNLFNVGNKEDSGQGEEGGTDEDAPAEEDTFSVKWGWIANVDAVAETCRCSWDDVWKMCVIEFLNLLCYRKDKMEKEKMEIEQWKKSH